MITGDYPITAQQIALQIGLRQPESVITGTELNNISDAELSRRIMTVNIFARVVPEQKLRLISHLAFAVTALLVECLLLPSCGVFA
jgi:Ca2+-transporting ATPase